MRMICKRVLMLALPLLAVGGCSSVPPERTSYYTLSGMPVQQSLTAKQCQGCRTVTVKVSVPSFIDNGGIAYYSGNLLVVAKNNLWSESVGIQMQGILADRINEETGPGIVALTADLRPSGMENDNHLSVAVRRFNGTEDGYAELEGSYVYSDEGKIRQGRFFRRVRQEDDGFGELVSALSRVWNEECGELVKDLF